MARAPALLFAAVALVALAAPAGATGADVTIGSTLIGAPDANICAQGFACTYVQTSGGAPVAVSPVDGQVVRWRLKAGSTGGTVKLRVLRPLGTSASFAAVASSATVTVSSAMNTFTTNLPIKAGDVVALDNSSNGLYFTSAPLVPLPLVKYFQPALPDAMTGAPNNQRPSVELLMNADVTPTPAGVQPPTPAISKLRVKPRKFRAATSGSSVARKRRIPVGTTVSYTLTTDATVMFGVDRAKSGRKRKGKCAKPGKRPRGKRCTRYTRVPGSFTVGGTAGANKFKFTGRIANRKLRRGRYRLKATPTAGATPGATAKASFQIR